ncbi:MAG: DUF3817 domain-containing protein [Actinomycetota bacterium]|nr:DUF3817 domain-containing protein [Actinomycetota bacterium]
MRQIRLLRRFAFWEATLFLALLVATVIKYTGHGKLAVAILGSVHGTVFTCYVILVLIVRARLRWSLLTTLGIIVAGFIPGGGYVVERQALNGARVDRHIDDRASSSWSPFSG